MTARRTLPYVTTPLPDEPLESWIETMAHAHSATLAEMCNALGLPTAGHSHNLRSWSTKLEPAQIDAIVDSTGLGRGLIHGMTRIHFAGSVVRHTRNGRISARSAAGGITGRYCPACLADSGGRWRLSWQFQFGFACPRHQIILADTCPGCGRPPRRLDATGSAIPTPGRCQNRTHRPDGTATRCGHDLRNTTAQPAPAGVVHAQRTLMRTVAFDTGRFGIYHADPQPAIRVLADLALISRLSTTAPDPADTARLAVPTAAAAATQAAAAIAALNDPSVLASMISGLVRAGASAPSYTEHTTQLQQLLADARGHHRPATARLRSAIRTPSISHAARAARIPTVLWHPWTEALASRRIDRDIAGTALAAAIVFTGTQLTHAAALELLNPGERGRRITHVMRDLDRSPPSVIHALAKLAAHLDHAPVTIDYARRRTLEYRHLLPRLAWQQICDELNVHPGGTERWTIARAALYQDLSGNQLVRAPFETAQPRTPNMIAQFRRTAPPEVLAALQQHGGEFLDTCNITEPPSWHPPLSIGGLEPPADPSRPAAWPTARPARAKLPAAAAADYRTGRSLRKIADQHDVGKQTVSRALTTTGISLRTPGRPTITLDTHWLRRRYLTELQTLHEIAAETGLSPSTISRHLRRAGIPTRPRGSGSRATVLRPDPGASTPLLQRVLRGQGARQRAERFVITIRHRSISAAAAEMGVSPAVLGSQLARLSRDAGGRLFIPAAGTRPQQPTTLARHLAAELQAHFAESNPQNPSVPSDHRVP